MLLQRGLCSSRVLYIVAGLSQNHNLIHEVQQRGKGRHLKPLDGKISRRYPKEELSCENKVGP